MFANLAEHCHTAVFGAPPTFVGAVRRYQCSLPKRPSVYLYPPQLSQEVGFGNHYIYLPVFGKKSVGEYWSIIWVMFYHVLSSFPTHLATVIEWILQGKALPVLRLQALYMVTIIKIQSTNNHSRQNSLFTPSTNFTKLESRSSVAMPCFYVQSACFSQC